MKIGAIAAGLAFLALLLFSGCPKSNNMLDHSKKPGVIPKEGTAPPGELTTGTPPPGGAPPPPPVDNAGSGDTGGGDTGGDTGGDSGGDDGGGEDDG